jgi:hypothetical protein
MGDANSLPTQNAKYHIAATSVTDVGAISRSNASSFNSNTFHHLLQLGSTKCAELLGTAADCRSEGLSQIADSVFRTRRTRFKETFDPVYRLPRLAPGSSQGFAKRSWREARPRQLPAPPR